MNNESLLLRSELSKNCNYLNHRCGLSSSLALPGPYPEKQATITEINTEMLPYAPRYAIEILGRKNRPNE